MHNFFRLLLFVCLFVWLFVCLFGERGGWVGGVGWLVVLVGG